MIEYTETKRHKILAFVLNFVLIFGLIWVPTPDSMKLPPLLANLDLYLTLLFAIPLLFQLRNIFRKTYLQFGPEGIKENISMSNEQFIKWGQTTGIRFFRMFFTTYLVVDLKEPQKWFDGKNLLQKIKGKGNYNRTRSPLHVPIRNLNVSPQKILQDLQEFLKGRSL